MLTRNRHNGSRRKRHRNSRRRCYSRGRRQQYATPQQLDEKTREQQEQTEQQPKEKADGLQGIARRQQPTGKARAQQACAQAMQYNKAQETEQRTTPKTLSSEGATVAPTVPKLGEGAAERGDARGGNGAIDARQSSKRARQTCSRRKPRRSSSVNLVRRQTSRNRRRNGTNARTKERTPTRIAARAAQKTRGEIMWAPQNEEAGLSGANLVA